MIVNIKRLLPEMSEFFPFTMGLKIPGTFLYDWAQKSRKSAKFLKYFES